MSSIKKESHQRHRLTRRPPPNASVRSVPSVNPTENDDAVIKRDMVIELDMENDDTRTCPRISSLSSISESALASCSSATESIRVSGSLAFGLNDASPQSTLTAAQSPTPITNTPDVASLSQTSSSQSHKNSSAVANSSLTTPNNNYPKNREKPTEVNISKRNKRRKKGTYFTLTDSSYCTYLRNRMLDATQSSVSLSSIRRTAMNHFQTIKYKPSLEASKKNDSSRRSSRFIQPQTRNVVTPHIHKGYDLNSRKLRRYILEDVMFINPVQDVLLLVCDQSNDFQYWKKIIEEQNSGLLTVVFGTKVYYQINASVIKNVSRGAFINGEYDNDMMDYHVLGIGGAAISLSFLDCLSSTSIELKFSQLLNDDNIQMWGNAPMRRNLIRVLQKRGKATRMPLLKCMLKELHGDHSQSLQLATVAQTLIKDDEAEQSKKTDQDRSVLLSMVGN